MTIVQNGHIFFASVFDPMTFRSALYLSPPLFSLPVKENPKCDVKWILFHYELDEYICISLEHDKCTSFSFNFPHPTMNTE